MHRQRISVEVDSGRIHNVVYGEGNWSCTCDGPATACSHLRASWLVVAHLPEEERPDWLW